MARCVWGFFFGFFLGAVSGRVKQGEVKFFFFSFSSSGKEKVKAGGVLLTLNRLRRGRKPSSSLPFLRGENGRR